MPRRVDVIPCDSVTAKVTITPDRITLKVNRDLEPLINIPWLVDIINIVVPLETQTLRGACYRNKPTLILYTRNNQQWDEIRLSKFWKEESRV